MHYSDEQFKKFSVGLGKKIPAGEILWQLRDALFNAITYRCGVKHRVPLRNRFGFFGYAVWWILKGRRVPRRIEGLPEPSSFRNGYLFLEARDAHFMTLYPLFEKSGPAAMAWLNSNELRSRFTPQQSTVLIEGAWTQFVRRSDFFSLLCLIRQVRRVCDRDFLREAEGRFAEYLVQFMAWRHFWREALPETCETVYTTSESAPVAKALFYEAKKRGLKRVHWCHGFRHATWQVTLASELVCNTQGDVRYFRDRVPEGCQVRYQQNPRLKQISEEVGPPRQLDDSAVPNFLFLSQGPESPYTPEMRLDDLKLLRSFLIKQEKGMLRIRSHPRENAGMLREALQMAGIDNYKLSACSLIDDLKWADVVGTSWSTGLLEAHACGRKCFWINAHVEQFLVVQELAKEKIGKLFLPKIHKRKRFK